jgi:hypothetical protein
MVDMAALGLRTPTFYPQRSGAARTGCLRITHIQKVSKDVKTLESNMTPQILLLTAHLDAAVLAWRHEKK